MAEPPLQIAPGELARWHAAGQAVVVLDVRETWELAICRLPDSLAIPLGRLPDRHGELPRDVPLVVLCHHGVRSMNATLWLRRVGFGNAVNLAGGIDAWSRDVDPFCPVY